MKKRLCLFLAILLVLCTTGCGSEIEDTNGADDMSLATITDDNIINLDLGASGSATSSSDSSIITEYYSKNFSGVEEIYSENFLSASAVTFNVTSLQVKEGNFRLVVVVDDEIVHDFDLNEIDQSYVIEDVKGPVSVRIAGESAAYQFYMEIW